MKLRPNHRYDLQGAFFYAVSSICEKESIYISCLNCINFKEQTELCGLVDIRPPAKVIAYGCPQWEDKDEIPF